MMLLNVPCLAVLSVLPLPQESELSGPLIKTPPVVEVRDSSVPAEGYRLAIASNAVTVTASDDAGLFYARETLRQLQDADGRIPCGTVADAPRYPFRCIHVDDGRHFFGKANMLRTLELMARYKLNWLVWHLAEDQGWRIQIDRYPNLTTYGATRSRSVVRGRHKAVFDDKPYGPFFYTKDDVREIVAKAKSLHIQIMPEIEMPGHTRSILAAYPELGCPSNPLDERTCWGEAGVCGDVVCAGNDDVLTFFRNVVDELCELFPGPLVSLGGDECRPTKAWHGCPRCRARMRALGFTNVMQLQGWLTLQMIDYVHDVKGRTFVGYSDIARTTEERADPKKVIILGGCDNPAQAYATLGYRVIGGPYEYCYFDFEQNAPDDPCVYASWWPGTVAVNTVCGFIPDLGIPDRFKKNVIGGVGYTWSEFTYNRAEFEWKLWPRAIALAQALWHPIEGFDCNSRFLPVVKKHVEQLRREGVNAASLPTRSQQALW